MKDYVKNLSMKAKLVVSFSFMVLLMVVIGLVGYRSIGAIYQNLDDIFSVRMPALDALIEADRDLQQLLVAERSMLFTDVKSKEFGDLVASYEENFQQSADRMEKFKKLTPGDAEARIYEDYKQARAEWGSVSRRIVDNRKDDTRAGRRLALDLALTEGQQKFEAMRDPIDALTQLSLEKAEQAHHRAKAMFRDTVISFFSIIGVGIIVTVVLVLFLLKAILGPVNRVLGFAETLQQGDLTARLEVRHDEMGKMSAALNNVAEEMQAKADVAEAIAGGDLTRDVRVVSEKDSLGNALHTMVKSLNNVVSELHAASEQVDAGSNQVAEASQTLSQGATEQASSLEEVSSSITQVGSQTTSNAENADQANKLAASARDDSQTGVRQMGDMVEAMNEINNSSQEISKIIKTIDDIAFQTNLLALNAAVEAARAGKHGKGFAVVAQEVRSLASRSAKATGETATLIENAIKKVSAGNEIAEQTSKSLDTIAGGITKVADLLDEIAAASNEQTSGVSQIGQAISQIDSVTQQNAANAEETSAAAQELSSQAGRVRQLMMRFKIAEQAVARPSGSAPDQAPDRSLSLPSPDTEAVWGSG
ncbi:MAG: methyl-accepting chemotaxis protein [Thermodesulfobacteriota bacterium]|nr:methyl-accepting chemotaxis protein [Thermodesulfobacteriota bacterium]